AERPHFRDLGERPAQPRVLVERLLRPAHHPPGRGVVLGLVPRADQTPVVVDRAVGQVGAQVSAPAGDGEVIAVVADGVRTVALDGSLGERMRNVNLSHGATLLLSVRISNGPRDVWASATSD